MAGRPTVVTKEVLDKLNQAFLQGFSDEEACLYAEIDPKTLYNYCNKYPYYSSRKEQLKQQPKILAKLAIYKDLKSGKIDTAKWYLERKARDEFSPKEDLERLLREEKDKWEMRQKHEETANYIKSVLENIKNPSAPIKEVPPALQNNSSA